MTDTTQSPFPCPWCDDLEENADETRLIRHIQNEHPDKPDAALSPEQWRDLAEKEGIRLRDFDADIAITFAHDRDKHGYGLIIEQRKRGDSESVGLFLAPSVRALIAVANAALPDSDRRKISRATIDDLRHAARHMEDAPLGSGAQAAIVALADVLGSYLPPER